MSDPQPTVSKPYLYAVAGFIAGFLVPVVGWAHFFTITCLSAAPGLILLVILRKPLNVVSAREAASAAA